MKLSSSFPLALTLGIHAAVAPFAAAQTLTVVSPHAGEQVNVQAINYMVRWSAGDIPGLAGFAVTRINGLGEEVGVCTAGAAERACPWFEPDPFTSALFVQALDASGATLIRVQAPPFEVVDGNLPSAVGFQTTDIGDVGRTGGAWGIGDSGLRVRGAGGDIWGTADAFHYLWYEEIQDANATFTIGALDGTHRWTKAGFMVRDNATPGSVHHFLLVSKEMGVAYQRRLTPDGESLHTSLSPSSTLPVTIQVMRRDSYVVMDFKQGDGPWQRAAQFDQSSHHMFGIAVTSHDTSVLATADVTDYEVDRLFDPPVAIDMPGAPGLTYLTEGVPATITWTHSQPVNTATVSYTVDGGQTWTDIPGCQSIETNSCVWENPGPIAAAARVRVVIEDPNDRTAWNVSWIFEIRGADGSLPQGWTNADVGEVGAVGSASFDAATGQFTVEGSGADVWDTADEFHFAYTQIARAGQEDDFDVTARVRGVENVHRWTKAGIMVRSGTGAGAQHAFLLATPGTEKGVAFQRRTASGGISEHTAGPAIGPPVWLKLLVRGGDVHAYYRQLATDPWTHIGSANVQFAGTTFEVGLAVSSHSDGTLATATFDNVAIERRVSLVGEDIGAVGVPGSGNVDGVTVTINGSGADIWNTADAFRYHWMQVSSINNRAGVSARVWSIENTHRWAKAGVMFREDTSPGSRHVMLIVSAERGVAMQYRDETGGISKDVAIVPGSGPIWLRLERHGSLFIGEMSTDGVTWSEVGRAVLLLGTSVAGGLAVTSHNNTTLATAVFDDVKVHDDYSVPLPGGR